MATQKTLKEQLPVTDMKFNLPASMAQQAGRVIYIAVVPFRMLSRLINFDTGNVLERSQRKTDPGRAAEEAVVAKLAKLMRIPETSNAQS